jgi:hypothetical protein
MSNSRKGISATGAMAMFIPDTDIISCTWSSLAGSAIQGSPRGEEPIA